LGVLPLGLLMPTSGYSAAYYEDSKKPLTRIGSDEKKANSTDNNETTTSRSKTCSEISLHQVSQSFSSQTAPTDSSSKAKFNGISYLSYFDHNYQKSAADNFAPFPSLPSLHSFIASSSGYPSLSSLPSPSTSHSGSFDTHSPTPSLANTASIDEVPQSTKPVQQTKWGEEEKQGMDREDRLDRWNWNEEFQSLLEMPENSSLATRRKYQGLARLSVDFVSAVVYYGMSRHTHG